MELRHDLRLLVQCPVSFSGRELLGEGTIMNLSTGGWQVASNKPVPQGTPLVLHVSLPDGEAPLEVELATVRWSSGERFGLKNLILGEQEWKRLRRFVVSRVSTTDYSGFQAR